MQHHSFFRNLPPLYVRLLPNRSPAAWGTQESPLGTYIFAAAPKTLPVGLPTFWLWPSGLLKYLLGNSLVYALGIHVPVSGNLLKKVATIRSNGCPTVANKCRHNDRCECMSHLQHYWKKGLRNMRNDLNGIQTHDICITSAMFSQLSYQSHMRSRTILCGLALYVQWT